MLDRFEFNGRQDKKIKFYKFWQEGNHPEEIYSEKFTCQKIDYIHGNPVKERIVERPQEYLFSSARNYAELDSMLDVITLTRYAK